MKVQRSPSVSGGQRGESQVTGEADPGGEREAALICSHRGDLPWAGPPAADFPIPTRGTNMPASTSLTNTREAACVVVPGAVGAQ